MQTGVSITPNGLYHIHPRAPGGLVGGRPRRDLPAEVLRRRRRHARLTSVPNYPASHGCVRLSVLAMDYIWDDGLIPLGTTVWVHGNNP